MRPYAATNAATRTAEAQPQMRTTTPPKTEAVPTEVFTPAPNQVGGAQHVATSTGPAAEEDWMAPEGGLKSQLDVQQYGAEAPAKLNTQPLTSRDAHLQRTIQEAHAHSDSLNRPDFRTGLSYPRSGMGTMGGYTPGYTPGMPSGIPQTSYSNYFEQQQMTQGYNFGNFR